MNAAWPVVSSHYRLESCIIRRWNAATINHGGGGDKSTGPVQALDQRHVAGFVLRRDDAMADQEIYNHQIAVELEIEPIADPLGDVLNRPKFKFFDLAILVYRREVRRQFKVVAKNLIRFHAVGASMAIG